MRSGLVDVELRVFGIASANIAGMAGQACAIASLVSVSATRMVVEGDPHSRPFAVPFLRIAREAHQIPLRLCVSGPLR